MPSGTRQSRGIEISAPGAFSPGPEHDVFGFLLDRPRRLLRPALRQRELSLHCDVFPSSHPMIQPKICPDSDAPRELAHVPAVSRRKAVHLGAKVRADAIFARRRIRGRGACKNAYRDACFSRSKPTSTSLCRFAPNRQELAKYRSAKLQPIQKSRDEGTASCSCYTALRTAAPFPGP